ncbi:uncharacterized protein LOC116607019 [Nematostella vectensis]|uniref:uncharacterized protein LOC116607019 n=1 Tax=Nematostella vectensis TaxID=45351 RepID=UPI0020770DDD|nr:uncharacterized protein LOC116607019 [Nematostella vectensis]
MKEEGAAKMAETTQVDFEVVDLACALLLYKNREQFMESVAYECEKVDDTFSKAAESWGKWGEDYFHCFWLIQEGITVLTDGVKECEGEEFASESRASGVLSECSEHDVLDTSRPLLQREESSPNGSTVWCGSKHGTPTRPANLFQNNSLHYKAVSKESVSKAVVEIEMVEMKSRAKRMSSSSFRRSGGCESINGADYYDSFRATLCTPENDLTATEDEEDHPLAPSPDSTAKNTQDSAYPGPHGRNFRRISLSRYKEATEKFRKAKRMMRSLPRGETSQVTSFSKQVRRARLWLSAVILSYLDRACAHQAQQLCKEFVSHMNALECVKWICSKKLETPSGIKSLLTKKLNGGKWRRLLEKFHFVNYIVWRYLMITEGRLGSGQELGIPVVITDKGAAHPIDDWRMRDKCQTCVEFERKTPYSCAVAVNTKDEILIIDSLNDVTVFSSDAKMLFTFSAATRRHKNARWMVGTDQDDRIYIGSCLGIGSEPSRPISIFNAHGDLIDEPELRGYWGQYHLYAVTRKALILCLAVGTAIGNRVFVHDATGKHLTSFPVNEISYPKHFTCGDEVVVVCGATSLRSDDMAIQTFDHTGQQLFYFKPKLDFQRIALDPLSGHIYLVGTRMLYDYRYLLCDTIILTGELNILGADGQLVQSGVKLRWPFRVIAGLAVMRSGLVAMVTVDEPYCAIHIL